MTTPADRGTPPSSPDPSRAAGEALAEAIAGETTDGAPLDAIRATNVGTTNGTANAGAAAGAAAGAHAARGFLTLGAGELVARMAAFGAAVYVSRTLGAARFGIVGFATAVLLYLQRFVVWELEAAGVSEAASSGADSARVVRTLFAYRLLVASFVVAVVATLGPYALPDLDATVLFRYALALFAVALNARWVFLMRREPRRPAMARIATEAIAATTVVMLVRGPDDVGRVPFGLVLGETAGALLLIVPLLREGAFSSLALDWSRTRPIVLRAFPLLVSGLLGLIVFNLDLVMLRFAQGASAAGYYAAAYAIVSLLVNLGMAYYANVLPAFMRLRDDAGARQALYDASGALAVLAILPVTVGGALVAPMLVQLIYGSAYAESAPPLAALMASVALNVLRFVPLAALVASGRPREVLKVSVVGAAVNVALNLALIPRFGMLGAATSTVTTDVVRLVINVYYVRGIGVGAGRRRVLWRPLVASVVMAAVVWPLRGDAIWLSVPAGAAAYGVVLLLLGALRVERGGRVVVHA